MKREIARVRDALGDAARRMGLPDAARTAAAARRQISRSAADGRRPDRLDRLAAGPRTQRVDAIGRKLEALGLGEPTNTPHERGGRHARRAERADDARHCSPCSRRLRALTARLFTTRLEKSDDAAEAHRLRFRARSTASSAAGWSISASSPIRRSLRRAAVEQSSGARPEILDRNGEVMATDVKTMSVFAEPRRIIDKDEATELHHRRLPRSRREGTAREARVAQGLRLGEARDHAEAAGGSLPPRPAGRRLLAREQARLSERAARRACARLRQYRQCRHRRHREIYRRAGPRRSARRRLPASRTRR